MQTEQDPGCYRLWIKDWRFWMTLFTIFVTATIAWANLRNEMTSNRGTIAVNTGRITTLETTVDEMVREQPVRDYIMAQIAKKQGIDVPRGFGLRD